MQLYIQNGDIGGMDAIELGNVKSDIKISSKPIIV